MRKLKQKICFVESGLYLPQLINKPYHIDLPVLFHMDNATVFEFSDDPVGLEPGHSGLRGNVALSCGAVLFEQEPHNLPVIIAKEFHYYLDIGLGHFPLALNCAAHHAINHNAGNHAEKAHYDHEMHMVLNEGLEKVRDGFPFCREDIHKDKDGHKENENRDKHNSQNYLLPKIHANQILFHPAEIIKPAVYAKERQKTIVSPSNIYCFR